MQPMLPSSLHEREPRFASLDFAAIFRRFVTQRGDLFLPVQAAIVDIDLRVDRPDLSGGSHDERIDLGEGRVDRHECPVERGEDGADLLRGIPVAAQRGRHLPHLERQNAQRGIYDDLENLLRGGPGDLFDVDAAGRRHHHEGLTAPAVDHHADIEFLRYVDGSRDEHLFDPYSLEIHAENRLRLRGGLVGSRGELDPSRLSPAADENLRLDDDGAADFLRRLPGVIGVEHETARRNRQVEFREERTGIRFMDLQGRPPLTNSL